MKARTSVLIWCRCFSSKPLRCSAQEYQCHVCCLRSFAIGGKVNGTWASSSDDGGAVSACLAGPVRALCSCIASGVLLPLESVAEE